MEDAGISGYWMLVKGFKILVTRYGLQNTGYRLQVKG
jgi:hypothetical protein